MACIGQIGKYSEKMVGRMVAKLSQVVLGTIVRIFVVPST